VKIPQNESKIPYCFLGFFIIQKYMSVIYLTVVVQTVFNRWLEWGAVGRTDPNHLLTWPCCPSDHSSRDYFGLWKQNNLQTGGSGIKL